MNDEKSPLLRTTSMTMAITRTRRRNENDDYSSISSSTSTVATTVISSSENNGDCNLDFPTESSFVNKKPREDDTEYNESDGILVIDIEDAIDRLGMGMFQFQIVLACGLCFASDAMEVLLLSFLALILQSQWGLSESQSDLIISVVFMGAMVGTLVLTPLGDKWGRRPIFAVTAATISLFGILTAFCTTYPQILMVRFMVGFGVGGLTVPYDALGEFIPSSRRAKNMLSTSFFWTAGSLLVPLFAWFTIGSNNKDNGVGDQPSEDGSWRAFVMLCALPSVVSTVLGIWFVPESPRWLLTRGKHEKALKILRQAAAKNGKDPFLAFPENVRLVDRNDNATKICTDNELSISIDNDNNSDSIVDGIQRDNIINEGRQQQQQQQIFHTDDEANKCNEFVVAPKSESCCMMCSDPQWRKMSFLLAGQWYGLAFMYYGTMMAVSIVFSNVKDDADDIENNEGESFDFDYGAIFVTSSAESVGLILAILIVDRIGRVPTQIWTYSLGGLCLLLLGVFDDTNAVDQEEVSQRPHLIVFAFLSKMFVFGATSVTWQHTAELLPTRFRATGHGLANAMGRIGGITCPFIVSRDTSLRTIGLIMFSVSITTSLFVKYLPETSGKALGNFDVFSEEQIQGQPNLLLSPGQQTSSSSNNNVLPSDDNDDDDDDNANDTIGGIVDSEDHTDQADERVDKRIISSFEII